MKNHNHILLFIFVFLPTLQSLAQKNYQVLTVPGIKAITHIDKKGKRVLASGRYVTPAGKTIQITHDPFGMTISPDGKKTVTIHNGVFTICLLYTSPSPRDRQKSRMPSSA